MSAIHAQVAADGSRFADVHGLIGEAHVQGGAVGIGPHGDGRDAEVAAGAG